MSTKTTIQNLIDTNLASGSDITAIEHRAVLTSVLNNLYPTTQIETNETGVITTSNANFSYTLNFTKIGRLVYVTGVANNRSGVILSGVDVFAFNDTEFMPDLALGQYFYNGYVFEIELTNTLKALSPIPVDAIIYFNFVYSTRD